MRLRLLPAIAGLAVGLILPAVAQEQNTVDPEVRQQIEAASRAQSCAEAGQPTTKKTRCATTNVLALGLPAPRLVICGRPRPLRSTPRRLLFPGVHSSRRTRSA
jgi:hypothetical protein